MCWFGKRTSQGLRVDVKPPKNFRQEIQKTIVGECNVKEVAMRKMPAGSVDRCTVCSASRDSQTTGSSQGSNLDPLNWVQCDR